MVARVLTSRATFFAGSFVIGFGLFAVVARIFPGALLSASNPGSVALAAVLFFAALGLGGLVMLRVVALGHRLGGHGAPRDGRRSSAAFSPPGGDGTPGGHARPDPATEDRFSGDGSPRSRSSVR